MTARDELAQIVGNSIITRSSPGQTADAILAAGYRKARTITTAEELDGLAEGSMILDADPDALLKDKDGRWLSLHDTDNVPYKSGAITFPATVLYEPRA